MIFGQTARQMHQKGKRVVECWIFRGHRYVHMAFFTVLVTFTMQNAISHGWLAFLMSPPTLLSTSMCSYDTPHLTVSRWVVQHMPFVHAGWSSNKSRMRMRMRMTPIYFQFFSKRVICRTTLHCIDSCPASTVSLMHDPRKHDHTDMTWPNLLMASIT